MIILDFGSGNSCKNDKEYVKRMIDGLYEVDTKKKKVIIKWQLFKEAGDNIPLKQDIFDFAYNYAKEKGYETTASVFDIDSLQFLLKYNIPFIKIANNKELYYLSLEVPRIIPIFLSYTYNKPKIYNCTEFICISEYPAPINKYLETFDNFLYISDHTINFDLYKNKKPLIVEWHYKLENTTGLDSGPFARTPEQLKVIL